METRTTPTLGLLLLFLCAVPGIVHAQQWVPVAGAPQGLVVCQTMSADTCQIASSMSNFVVTRNGGASFDSAQTMFTTEWCTDMHFPTALVGYACGGSHYGYYNNVITKTVNGGASWFPLTNNEFPGFSFGRIHFITEDIGFVSGDWANFLKTVDGGSTFTPIDLQLPDTNYVLDIDFDGYIGYVCTKKYTGLYNDDDIYRILKTTDLGDTWSILYADTIVNNMYTLDRGINRVRFLGDFGLACGNNGILLRTTDGGATWLESTVLSDTTFFRDLEVVNEQTAFIMTQLAYAGEFRNTLRTDDGGLTWAAISEKFICVSVKDGVGYAIDDSYQLFKNTQIMNGVAEVDRASLSIFPNPSTGMVHVRLPQVMAAGMLTVHDVNGRILLEETIRNVDQFSITTTGLAAGAYVVEVRGKGSSSVHRQRLILQ